MSNAAVINLPTKFLQYLWGIETNKNDMNLYSMYIGFYSTYEELKLIKQQNRI